MESSQEEQHTTHHSSPVTGVIWIIAVFCFIFVGFLYLGSEPSATVQNTKLFPLFESKKYHKLEKKIDSANKVLLIGDDEDGLGIFIDQYVNQRNQLANIKRRTYHYGKNLEYASDNIFTKIYKTALDSIFNQKSSQPTFWVIESEGALNIADVENINQFIQSHVGDKFLVTAQIAPSKASKIFEVIQYEQLPKKYVSQFLYATHKIDKVNAQNLLDSFGGNLETINDIFEGDDAEMRFVQKYQQQSEQLNELLVANNKQVKKFFDQMCKNGQVKAKKQLTFIPSNNKLVRYEDDHYEWRNINSIFAFSDRFNVICQTALEIDYIPDIAEQQSFFAKWFAFNFDQAEVIEVTPEPEVVEQTKKSQKKQKKQKDSSKTKKNQNKKKK